MSEELKTEDVSEVETAREEFERNETERVEGLESNEVVEHDYTEEARKSGWKPLEEFEGNPKYHVSAEEYVLRGRPTHKQIQLQQEKLEQMEALLQEHARQFQVTEQVAYERAMQDLQAKRQDAVNENDIQAYDQATREIEQLKAPVTADTQPQVSDVVTNYLAEHSWASNPKDPEEYLMQEDLFRYDEAFKRNNPNADDAAIVKFVHDVISKKYPHRFKTKEVNSAPAVTGVKIQADTKGADLPHPMWDKMSKRQQTYAKQFEKLGTCTIDEYVTKLKQNGDI